uniref:Chitin-binding LysM effector n=1 Tax=Gigaspora rosea TaxID=44941 RepID=A0A5P8I3K8_9GLOM|nr:chitin-binding LysM effector [Gigaspora rosea]
MRLNQYLLLLTVLFALIAVASCAIKTCTPVYVVESGDTLEKIANKLKVTLLVLKRANPCITNPNVIFPGCIIRIPNATRCF